MGVYLRLRWNDRELNLHDKENGRYYIDGDFAPPAAGDVERGFTFNVIIQAGGSPEMERAISDLQAFLDLAQDPHFPLYLDYKGDDTIPFSPKFGQFGRIKSYRVLSRRNRTENTITHQVRNYSTTAENSSNTKLISNTVFLRIAGSETGLRQIAARGEGAINADFMGRKDGHPRGVLIADAETNNFTNGVFGSGTAWDNGWTTGGALITEKVAYARHPEYVMYGKYSAKLTHDGSGGSRAFTQSINVGSTNNQVLGCVARLQDGGTVTTDHIDLWYSTTQTTTITALGDNGWYLVTAEVTGVNSAINTGCRISNSNTVFVDGFFICERDLLTMPFYGDMVGCAWSGTRHDSTTTRTKAELTIPFNESASIAEGTFIFDVKMHYPESELSADLTFMETTSYKLSYSNSSARFEFTDGTNTATATTKAGWVTGDEITFHCTYHPDNGVNLYVNSTAGTGAGTYTPPVIPASFYIGRSLTLGDEFPECTYRGITIYDRELSAAQVTSDYTARNLLIADDQATDPFPILWNVGGSAIFDNANDGSGRQNWGVIMNVGGDLAALTEWLIDPDYHHTLGSGEKFATYWGNSPVRPKKYLSPDVAYSDTLLPAWTATADALGLADVELGESFFNKISFFVGGIGTSTAESITTTPSYNFLSAVNTTPQGVIGETRSIDFDTSDYRAYYLGSLDYTALAFHPEYREHRAVTWYTAVSSFSNNITNGLTQIIVGSLFKVEASSIPDEYSILPGKKATLYNTSGEPRGTAETTGDELMFVPGYYNIVTAIMCDDGAQYDPLNSTNTVETLFVIPQYRIM